MSMKKILSKLLGGLLLLSLCVSLTSCEDVLGKWEKPVPQVPSTVVEEVKVLGAALEKGATVTINYKAGTTEYIATFEKGDGDAYTLISNVVKPSTARAMTRSAVADFNVPTGDAANATNILLTLVGDKLVFTVKSAKDATLFKALMNVADGAVTVINANTGGKDCTIGSVSVNDEVKEIKNPEMKYVNITRGDFQYPVKFSDGDTWANVVEIYKDIDLVKITSTTEGYISVEFSMDIVADMLKAVSSSGDPEVYYNNNFSGSFYLYAKENSNLNSRAGTRGLSYIYTPIKSTDAVDVDKTYILGPAFHALTSAVVGDIVDGDGKAYTASDKDRLTGIGVTAVAMVAYVGSETGVDGKTNGLALALTDETNTMDWSNAKDGAVSHYPAAPTFITSSWMLPSNVQWTNMISAAGGYEALRDCFSSVGGDNLQSVIYWSSTEGDPGTAWGFDFGNSTSSQFTKSLDVYRVRACLAF